VNFVFFQNKQQGRKVGTTKIVGRTDRILIARPRVCISCSAVKKNMLHLAALENSNIEIEKGRKFQ